MKEKEHGILTVLEKIETIENELRWIREQIVQNMNEVAHTDDSIHNFNIGYTLDDLYNSFGNSKKHYAKRMRNALQQQGINTLPEFLALTPGQLLELDNVGVGTLLQTKKALDRLGISW